MNGEDRADLKQIIQRMDESERRSADANQRRDEERDETKVLISEIHTCLVGKADDHKDDGLIGDVNRNTAFRSAGTKVLWLFATALIGLIVKAIFFTSSVVATP